MLELIKNVKEGIDPQASKALNELIEYELAPLVNLFIGMFYPVFKDSAEIKGYIYESVWNISKNFKGIYPGEFVSCCKIGIKKHLLYMRRTLNNSNHKTEKLIHTITTTAATDAGAWLVQYDRLIEKITRKQAFLQTYKKYIKKANYVQMLNILYEDPYIDSLVRLTGILNEKKSYVHKRLTELKKYYGGKYTNG